jgi:hypothetical protein
MLRLLAGHLPVVAALGHGAVEVVATKATFSLLLHMHTCPPRRTTKLAGSGFKLEAFLLSAFPGVP